MNINGRSVGAALTMLAAAAAVAIGGTVAAAEPQVGPVSRLVTEASAAPDEPTAGTGGRGRGGYGYPTTPPPDELPTTPPGELPTTPPAGELPSTPPAGEVPSSAPTTPPAGVSPAHVPADELPVTGVPLVLVAAAGGALAAAGIAVRLAARRRRVS
jgi:hypothetical protein